MQTHTSPAPNPDTRSPDRVRHPCVSKPNTNANAASAANRKKHDFPRTRKLRGETVSELYPKACPHPSGVQSTTGLGTLSGNLQSSHSIPSFLFSPHIVCFPSWGSMYTLTLHSGTTTLGIEPSNGKHTPRPFLWQILCQNENRFEKTGEKKPGNTQIKAKNLPLPPI